MIAGIHHITAMASDPQRNIDFYSGALGLRLIKVTVNYDNPGVYHLYYGDGAGNPGTVITFFPKPEVVRGKHGNGQVTATAFAVPMGSLPFWRERLKRHEVLCCSGFERFGELGLRLEDPDGMLLELIESPSAAQDRVWKDGKIPMEVAIRGFHSATLSEEGFEQTARLLGEVFNFEPLLEEGNRFRYASNGGGPAAFIDLVCAPDGERGGHAAAGVVHHIALSAGSEDEVAQSVRENVKGRGLNVTPVLDRTYFRSIYFREPGGVLFEVATAGPGFTVDEPIERLGSGLRLPKWLEERRGAIEAALPRISFA